MSRESSIDGDLTVAIAHWHVPAWGGAEYLVTKLAEALETETVYTLGDPDPDDPNPYGDVDWVDVSQGPAAGLKRRFGRAGEYALWEDVDWRQLGDPDILLTSGATTRAVITPDGTLHVNYCHSPPRWFYDLYHDRKGSLTGRLARPLVRYLRTRDVAIDPRVDQYLVNSPIIERRVWKYYKRDADVLYPPVEVEKYEDAGDDGYYLHLGRLDEEKGVPAVVSAFEDLDATLVLAGGSGDIDDSVRRQIERTPNIDYRGFVSDDEKRRLLANCRALVFNGRREDFGIVPIEANASGKPVLARDEGFPGLYLTPGTNGYLHDGTPAGIVAAVDKLETEPISIDPAAVERFSYENFRAQLREFLEATYEDWANRFTVENEQA